MIIEFNPSVFTQNNIEILREILNLLLKDQHLVDTQGLRDEFNQFLFKKDNFKNYFSQNEIDKLSKYLPQTRAKITSLHKSFITRVVIGDDDGQVSPENAIKILKERSKIILENKFNDKKFLKGVCDKYTSHPQRKNIYLLIQKAFESEYLETEGGAIGEIIKNVDASIDSQQYKGVHKYKLMILFDSDKKNVNDSLGNTQQKIIGCVKNIRNRDNTDYEKVQDTNYDYSDKIVWHILYKRKIENYIPLKVLFENIHNLTEEQKIYLKNLQSEELDFIEYNNQNIGIGEAKIKEQLPEMFLTNFSYQELENICNHHKTDFIDNNNVTIEVSEIEQILLKIAKII